MTHRHNKKEAKRFMLLAWSYNTVRDLQLAKYRYERVYDFHCSCHIFKTCHSIERCEEQHIECALVDRPP
jgi:hypothetical protein